MMLCTIWVCRRVIPVAYQVAGWANTHWFDAMISGTVLLTAAILCAQLLKDYLSANRCPATHGDLGRDTIFKGVPKVTGTKQKELRKKSRLPEPETPTFWAKSSLNPSSSGTTPKPQDG